MTRMMNSHVNSSEMQTNNIIINLLLSLPKHQHQQLYSQPSTALAILKLIPNPIPVTNLIYAQKPIPLTTVTSCWSVPETDLKLLFSLHILEKSNGCVMVDETFKRNLHWAVVGGYILKKRIIWNWIKEGLLNHLVIVVLNQIRIILQSPFLILMRTKLGKECCIFWVI